MTIYNFQHPDYSQSFDIYADSHDAAWAKLEKLYVYSRCPISKLWKIKQRCQECSKPTDKMFCRWRCEKDSTFYDLQ